MSNSFPQNDSRSVEELIDAAFNAFDEDERWNAVAALHWRGTKDVLVQAGELCTSGESTARRLGADILGQLGVPCRTFPRQCVELLLGMINGGEEDDDVLQAIFVAFSHLDAEMAVPSAIQFANHPNPEVRQAVVLALGGHDNPEAIDALIRLSDDDHEEVRDWATFGLGTLTEADTPHIRNALAARLDDFGGDVRGEALVGLARRKDSRAIAGIREDIEAGRVTSFVLEAAEMIADRQLLPDLAALRDHWDIDHERLEQAIAACSK
jgi:HEAT repeat protein